MLTSQYVQCVVGLTDLGYLAGTIVLPLDTLKI